jgi:NifB/MoaA-like Fe-S oxidoreductase
LLTGQDFLNVRERVVGDFVTIPRITIKSDEPIFLDGMTYEDLKRQFSVPVYDLDTNDLITFLSQ